MSPTFLHSVRPGFGTSDDLLSVAGDLGTVFGLRFWSRASFRARTRFADRPNKPISTVKTAWKATLRRPGVTAFPIYTLRHVFCTRLSEVAPDAVVQRAMRHSSPETKRHYQLGMAEQVRHAVNKANKRLYGKRAPLHFRDSLPQKDKEEKIAVC